jgi:SAM-dependent methyltransferase
MKIVRKSIFRNCPLCRSNIGILFSVIDDVEILRCCDCKMVYVDIDEMVIYDSNQYQEEAFYNYYKTEPIYTISFYDDLLLRITKFFKHGFKILEFGCGSGMFMRRARNLNLDIYGLDYSPYSAKAKELFNLSIDINDINNSIYNENEFDVIISHATYEHLINPIDISKKLLRFLKKDGLFIICGVPNFNTITIQLFKNFWNNGPLGHVNHFEKQSLKKMFDILNLKTISIKTYGWNIWYLIYLLKVITNKKECMNIQGQSSDLNNYINNYEKLKPTTFQKIVSNIYFNFVFPSIGNSIEAWSVK